MALPSTPSPRPRWLKWTGIGALASLGVFCLTVLLLPTSSPTLPPAQAASAESSAVALADTRLASLPDVQVTTKPFRRGETLGGVMAELGLGGSDAQAAIDALRAYVDPRKIRPGDLYRVEMSPADGLRAFEMTVPGRGRALLSRQADHWFAQWTAVERSVEARILTGELKSSFEEAVREAGAEATLAYKIADVLQWDLDFNRDLRQGDRFEVVFEEVYHDGEFHDVGDVVALRYLNRDHWYEAFRYGKGGYYDGDGRPLKKMFLKSPLRFSRVTSGFSMRRFHPVLKTMRPHYGVDYGAPVGTPVEVTANGTVVFAGWDGGGGRTVKVRHSGGYITNYLHLSRFADGVRPGRQVRQGEVIAYVGQTGLATGPHLDYRVKLNDRWINPLSIGSVPAKPLGAGELATYLRWRDALREGLSTGKPGPLPEDLRAQLASLPVAVPTAEADVATARR